MSGVQCCDEPPRHSDQKLGKHFVDPNSYENLTRKPHNTLVFQRAYTPLTQKSLSACVLSPLNFHKDPQPNPYTTLTKPRYKNLTPETLKLD